MNLSSLNLLNSQCAYENQSCPEKKAVCNSIGGTKLPFDANYLIQSTFKYFFVDSERLGDLGVLTVDNLELKQQQKLTLLFVLKLITIERLGVQLLQRLHYCALQFFWLGRFKRAASYCEH